MLRFWRGPENMLRFQNPLRFSMVIRVLVCTFDMVSSAPGLITVSHSTIYEPCLCSVKYTGISYLRQFHRHMTSSSLLTKLRRPIIVSLQFILGNRRKGMLEDLLKVLDHNIGRTELLRGDIPESHPLSSAAFARIVLPGRIRRKHRRTARTVGIVLTGDQISFLILTKLLRLLASSQRLHQCLLHHDLDIGTRRSLGNLSQRFVILVR
mmetsp:Transcript_25139/g.72699  ORF Transcript_25139/g.72699 Transcript_25139/m.72699 type:complete len:209 (-) Transcript_25139:391-1017(-)